MEGRTTRQSLGRIAVGAAALAVVSAVALAAFVWPAARLEPRDLPLGVAGPPAATAALEQRLAERGDAFDVRRYADEAEARAAIEEREVYGALVAGGDNLTLLTASAASPAVAQMLEGAFASRDSVRVVDVVPADPDDSRGAAFNSLFLPLTLMSVLVGVVSGLFVRRALARAAALVGAALLAALVAVAVVQGWLGVIPGEWWANAGVIGLLVFAIGAPVAGLAGLLGPRGAALAAAVLVFCGNPWSGVSTAPDLLPGWVGFIGQLLPPGAGGSLLRSSAFFDGGGFGTPLAVLLAWAALGLAAVLATTFRNRHEALDGGSHEQRDHDTERHERAPAHV